MVEESMSDEQNDRDQQLFLRCLELPEEERDAWLVEQCGDDHDLLDEVRSLLRYDSPDIDLLEKGVDIPTVEPTATTGGNSSTTEVWTEESADEASSQVDSGQFLSKLSELGVFSDEEIVALGKAAATSDDSSDPRHIASKLVTDGKLTAYQAAALLKGQPELLVDKYLILNLLDTGGMGMVFQAIHRPMNRIVAMKMISKQLLASEDQVKRFQREVRVAATLEHPNVVRAYDADQSKGVHFLVMEYVRGENLTKAVKRAGPFTVEMAVDCIRQAAKGLHYAHGRGVVHRDIKPSNLMMTNDGTVKVLDLGLANVDESLRLMQSSTVVLKDDGARLVPSGSHLTQVGDLLGTISFMAPEQALDVSRADTRSDIYSLGCTLYYLLMGEAPYTSSSTLDVLLKHRDAEIPSLRSARPDVPDSVDAICQRMLAKEPSERYQSMADLLSAIDDCGVELPEERPRKKTRSEEALTSAHTERDSNDHSPARQPSGSNALWAVLGIAGLFAAVIIGIQYLDAKRTAKTSIFDTDENVSPAEATIRSDELLSAAIKHASQNQFALEFDGKNSHVLLPVGHKGTDPLTIEVVLDIDEQHHEQVLGQAIVANNDRNGLSLDIENGCFNFLMRTESGRDGYTRASSSGLPPVGTRAVVAAVFDGERMRLFVNGKLAQTTKVPNKYVPSQHPFRIGASADGEGIDHAFAGRVHEVRISNTPRYENDYTATERFEKDDYTLALYRFDEGSGIQLADASGKENHGKIQGAAWVPSDNYALKLATPADRVDLPNFGYDGSSPFTLEFWYQSPVVQKDYRKLIVLDGVFYFESNLDGRWQFVGRHDGVFSRSSWGQPQIIGQPVHAAAVFDKGTLNVFVNGLRQELEVSYFGHKTDGRTPTFDRKRFSHDNRITARSFIGSPYPDNPEGLLGIIDEVRYSNVVRYTEEFTPPIRFVTDKHTLALYHFDEGTGDRLIDLSGNGHHGTIQGGTWVRRDGESITEIGRAEPMPLPDNPMIQALVGQSDQWEWSEPKNLGPLINSKHTDGSPFLTLDGRTLFFSSYNREGGKGGTDIWMSTRPSVRETFTAPINLGPHVNGAGPEESPVLSPDHLVLYFASQRTGGVGEFDLYQSQRESIDDPFTNPVLLRGGVNTSYSEESLAVSSDGRMLIFVSDRPGGIGGRDLWMCTRNTELESFGEAINLGAMINSNADEVNPQFLPDGSGILYSSDLAGDFNMHLSLLDQRSGQFGEPSLVAAPIASKANEDAGTFSGDGRQFIFQSFVRSGKEKEYGQHDLWISHLVLKNRPIGPALKLETPGDRVGLPYFGYDGSSPFTLECWCQLPTIQEYYGNLFVVDGAFGLETNPEGGWNFFGLHGNRVFSRTDWGKPQIIGQPVHLAAVFDGQTRYVFENGVRQDANMRYFDNEDALPDSTSGMLNLSYESHGAPRSSIGRSHLVQANGLIGIIDEVRYSNVVRYTENFTPSTRFETDEHTIVLYHLSLAV